MSTQILSISIEKDLLERLHKYKDRHAQNNPSSSLSAIVSYFIALGLEKHDEIEGQAKLRRKK